VIVIQAPGSRKFGQGEEFAGGEDDRRQEEENEDGESNSFTLAARVMVHVMRSPPKS